MQDTERMIWLTRYLPQLEEQFVPGSEPATFR